MILESVTKRTEDHGYNIDIRGSLNKFPDFFLYGHFY